MKIDDQEQKIENSDHVRLFVFFHIRIYDEALCAEVSE
jgi:hypothetical protein